MDDGWQLHSIKALSLYGTSLNQKIQLQSHYNFIIRNSKIITWRVAFSPDSTMLAAGASDGTLTIWDISTKEAIDTFQLPSAVSALSFSPDGKSVTAGGLDAGVWLFPVDPK